jgi:hypothetical protein
LDSFEDIQGQTAGSDFVLYYVMIFYSVVTDSFILRSLTITDVSCLVFIYVKRSLAMVSLTQRKLCIYNYVLQTGFKFDYTYFEFN